MSKYRVTFDVLGDKTEKTWVEITVEAESERMAKEMAKGKAIQRNSTLRNKTFSLRQIVKVG